MKISYHGHSVVRIETDSHKIIIDPFITGNPKCDLDPDKVDVDVILLTHGQCELHRHGRRDPGHRRHRRLRSEGAAGVHRGPPAPAARRLRSLSPPGQRRLRPRRGAGGQDASPDQESRRFPGLRAGGPSGHGPGGLPGHDRQHAAAQLPEGPRRVHRPQRPQEAGRGGPDGAGCGHPQRLLPRSPAVRRQRPEGAGGP